MKKHLRFLKVLLFNVFLLFIVVMATVYDHEGFSGITVFTLILVSVKITIAAINDKLRLEQQQAWRSIPAWLNTIFDFAIIGLLAYHWWMFMAVLWFVQYVMNNKLYSKDEQSKEGK